jgi:hypothetical protein
MRPVSPVGKNNLFTEYRRKYLNTTENQVIRKGSTRRQDSIKLRARDKTSHQQPSETTNS